MEGKEEKEESSLPPDYVSLAQLQQRWLKKQEDRNQKEKQEERKNNDVNEKLWGGTSRDEMEKDGRTIGVIEKKGKWKDMIGGGFENGEENKKKNKRFRKKKYAEGERKGKEVEKEKKWIEIKELETRDGCEGVEIVDGELKGIKDIASVSMVGVLPRFGEKRMGFRGGISINGKNRGSFYKIKNEYGGRFNELKQSEGRVALEKRMEDEKGYVNKKRRERGRSGKCKEGETKLKEIIDDVLEGNEVEMEYEKKAVDEILEDFDEKCGLNGRESNGVAGQSNKVGNEGEGLSDNKMALVEKVDHDVLVVEPLKNGEKWGVGKGYPRYGNWRGNFRGGRRYTRFERFDGRQKTKQRECGKMWVKKEGRSGADDTEARLSDAE